jgi:tRNA dimethylallyltransferase
MNIRAISGRPRAALIAGPTASGKSALALALAERTGGTVINADSAQVYADLCVLTARPTPEEEARAPHRLFGHVDGADTGYSAARWAGEARLAIAEAVAAGSLPILVGGTGLYMRTLIDGIAPVPPIDAEIRATVRALPVTEAFDALSLEDPEATARLSSADTTRVARALEVIRSTGKPIAEWQQARQGGIGDEIDLRAVILLPDRAWLFDRIDRRFAAMMEGGAVEEVRALLTRPDLPRDAPIRRAIGVPEIGGMLAGEIQPEEAHPSGAIATRQYAKRQYTWFRNQPPPEWVRITESQNYDINSIIDILLRD